MAVERPVSWNEVSTLTGPEEYLATPPLNIMIIGQGPFAVDVMNELREDGHNITGVVAPMTKVGKKDDALRTAAIDAHLGVHNLGKLKSTAFSDEITKTNTDLIVGANLTATILPHIPNGAPQGMVAFHPSLLPEYKGKSAINWQLINGETTSDGYNMIGLSSYRIEDDGDPSKIDSGRIIGQVVVEAHDSHTSASVYREILSDVGVRLMRDSVRRIAHDHSNGVDYGGDVQESEGTAQPPIERDHTRIDWSQPANKIYNLIRGAQNSPGAWTTSNGDEITLFDASLLEGPTINPGKATLGDKNIQIETGQGIVTVQTLQGKIPSIESVKPSRLPANEFSKLAKMQTYTEFS